MAGIGNIERLYGATHVGDSPYGEVFVKPSKYLMRDVLNQPQGTTIAIEYNPDLQKPIPVKGRKPAVISEGSHYYWQWLVRAAKRARLDIQFLEDPSLYSKAFSKKADAERLYSKIIDRAPDMPLQTFLDLSRAEHKTRIESQYAYHTEREDEMIRRLAQIQPAIAVVGRAHGETFAYELERLSAQGVVFQEYIPETVYDEVSYTPRADLDWDTDINPKFALDRKLLERKYKAVTEGRVTDGTPDFIGTWNFRIPAEGLFEVFLETGAIEDVLGTADITGTFTQNRVVFNKVYNPKQSAKETLRGNLHYETERDTDGKFRGEWGVGAWGGGYTVLMPFKPGIDINKDLGLNESK